MRERWARRLAVLTCLLVLGLTAVFAASRNLGTPTGVVVAALSPSANDVDVDVDPDRVASGREVYQSLDCASCHSIAGEGSPRSPLDGLGRQLDRSQIREWIIGGDSVADELSPRALRVKRGYRELDPGQLEAMIEYLASLTE